MNRKEAIAGILNRKDKHTLDLLNLTTSKSSSRVIMSEFVNRITNRAESVGISFLIDILIGAVFICLGGFLAFSSYSLIFGLASAIGGLLYIINSRQRTASEFQRISLEWEYVKVVMAVRISSLLHNKSDDAGKKNNEILADAIDILEKEISDLE